MLEASHPPTLGITLKSTALIRTFVNKQGIAEIICRATPFVAAFVIVSLALLPGPLDNFRIWGIAVAVILTAMIPALLSKYRRPTNNRGYYYGYKVSPYPPGGFGPYAGSIIGPSAKSPGEQSVITMSPYNVHYRLLYHSSIIYTTSTRKIRRV